MDSGLYNLNLYDNGSKMKETAHLMDSSMNQNLYWSTLNDTSLKS